MKNFFDRSISKTIPLMMLLTVQGFHTYAVYKSIVPVEHWNFLGVLYSIGVEYAVLLLTRKGWIKVSLSYMAITLTTNLLFTFSPPGFWLSAVVIGVVLSVTIWIYAHLWLADIKEKQAAEEAQRQERLTASTAAPTVAPPAAHSAQAAAAQSGTHLPYECPECGERFETSAQRNGHISAHKAKGEWDESRYPTDWKKPISSTLELAFNQNGHHYESH